jgi:hypothetical protein
LIKEKCIFIDAEYDISLAVLEFSYRQERSCKSFVAIDSVAGYTVYAEQSIYKNRTAIMGLIYMTIFEILSALYTNKHQNSLDNEQS